MDRFKAGRIVRIKVKGFMTYDDLELIPKEGLNLIIGLNGSGKSSIMSAICLGLGGKPQSTGKSAQPSDFIKHGHTKATIEIELEEPKGRNVVIVRTIQGDRSAYFLNGSPTNQSEVMVIAKKYNIDVSNLCQFLPQEKVVEFSKMDKKKRLDNMLQAIGEPQMFTTFEQLKQMRVDCNNLEKDLKLLHNNKNTEVQKNSRLKAEVEKHEERKRLQGRLKELDVRKKVLKYEVMRHHLNELKTEKKKLEAQKQKMLNEKNALEAEISSSAFERDDHVRQMKGKQMRIKALTEKLSKNSSLLSELHEKVHLAKVDFRTMITEKINQQTRLAELKKQIIGLKEQYDQLKGEEKINSSQTIQNLSQHDAIRKDLSQLDPELERINLELNRFEFAQRGMKGSMDKLKNEEDKNLRILAQRFRPTYEAVCWLKENMGSFKSTICMPALLSIKVTNDRHSKFIENNVNIRDLLAFVCQDPDDVKRLTHILRVEKNLPVNIALAPDTGISSFNSPRITPAMRNSGIEGFLKDLFTAPDPVMCYLCKIYFLHCIPICNQNANKNVEYILQTFRTFFTETERVSGTRSRYGNKNLSVKRDHIVGKNLLLNSKDQSEQLHLLEEQLKESMKNSARLKDQYEECKRKRIDLERKQEQLRAEKAELLEKVKKIKNIQILLRQKTEMYNRKEAEVIDEEEEKAKETAKICALNKEKMTSLANICSELKELHVLKLGRAKHIPLTKVLSRRLSELTEKIRKINTESQDVERQHQDKVREFDRVKASATALFTDLKNSTDQELLKNQLPGLLECNHEKAALVSISNSPIISLEEVEQKIANIQAQLELNSEENPAAVRDYEERQIRISETQNTIEEQEKKLEDLNSNIAKKKFGWLQKLEKHINNINTKFTHYYKCLECAGEVSLDKSVDTNNFLEYGLQIRLKYRVDEDFMELSQTHHSGGECSVAAIIFILSLQELTNVPFRCIDEINQGMDAVNERKIYELIADASKSGSSCSQYFLLTPKLLMDLAYHNSVAVHIIYNSRFLRMGLNLKEHLKAVKGN